MCQELIEKAVINIWKTWICVSVWLVLFWFVSGYTPWESQCSGIQSKTSFSRIITYLLGWVSRLWACFCNLILPQFLHKHTHPVWLYLSVHSPSDNGPGLSLPNGKECRRVWGSTEFWSQPVEQRQRGRQKSRSYGVSLPGVWVRGEAVCREKDRREWDATFAHACEWQ